MLPYSGLTILCLASYFKGVEFLEECKRQGATVILATRDTARDEPWPREAIDDLLVIDTPATPDTWVHAISTVAHHRHLDRIVALEEYDVMNAALVREHLRVPGMGTSTARLFRDKLAMRVKASETGIRVPDFVHVLNEGELRAFMDAVPPPWVLKPRTDVSAIGIQKLDAPDLVWRAVEALDARPSLAERSSHFLLERFVAGEVYHVDALVQDGHVLFAGVNRYWRPPMEVAHHGGVFVSATVPRGSDEERELLRFNQALLSALGFKRGATHAEFIRSQTDGQFYFLEVAARVGGAHIADVLEAASGANLWREWANVELARDEFPYALPPLRQEHAGIALALARHEWPDTSSYADPEVVYRVRKRYHIGLVVRSASHARVEELLRQYVDRIRAESLAVLPPRERAG